MDNAWLITAATATLALLGTLVMLAVRTGLRALVDRSVNARFDRELESVRSDLRLKEAKIVALQSNVLSGRASRQSLLNNRRVEATEALWQEALKLDALHWPARMLQVLNIEEVDKRASNDPKVREFMQTISGNSLDEQIKDVGGEGARLFIPEHAWQIFAAYRGLLIFSYMRIKTAAMGVGGEKFFKDDEMIADIKRVMPHFSDYLDKWGIAGAVGLVANLKELLFEALRAALLSDQHDSEDVEGLRRIMDKVGELDQQMASGTKPLSPAIIRTSASPES